MTAVNLSEWKNTTLGESCECITGFPFSSAQFARAGRRLVRGSNVKRGALDWSRNITRYWPKTEARLRPYALRAGDIVIAMDGALVGRSFARVNDEDLPAYLVQRVARLRGHAVDQNLLYQWINSSRFQTWVDERKTNTAIPHISPVDIFDFSIDVPNSREEQRLIGLALEDVDTLIDSLARLIAKKRDVKQGMMQALITGRTRLPGFTGEWREKAVGSFANVKAGGTPSTSVSRYWGGNIRWMSSGEVHQKQVHEVEGRISLDGLRASSAQMFPANTVLIALAGQGRTRGTAAIARVDLTTNQSLAGILPAQTYDSTYLYYNLDSRYNELRGASTGDGGRGGLNLRIIKNLEVALPSVDEQRAIGRILLDADAEIEVLERRLESARAVKTGMMQELLTGRTRLPVEEEA